jgi:menaquinone-dependent protoporphyrinogen oxidase
MARILAVYGTSHGHTARIVRRLAESWRNRNIEVDVYHAEHLSLEATLEDYDGVVVGASVHWGRHQASIEHFVQSHRPFWEERPSAFFSVSGAMAGEGRDSRRAARGYLEDFRRRTGWDPDLTRCFAGSMSYSRYDRFERWIVRAAAWFAGSEETTRDREYTDWDRVDSFADRFAEYLATSREERMRAAE